MKKQFKNSFATGIDSPVRTLINIFFTVSSIGSGICIAHIAAGFVFPEATFETHPTLFVFATILGICMGSAIDFLIIKRLGRFAFAETLAWISGQFQFSMQRRLNTIIFLSIACFGVALSFITSFDGSTLAAGMAPTLSTSATTVSVVKSERDAINSVLLPYRKAVKAVKSEIASEINSKTSAALTKLIQEGNKWAMGEKAKIKSAIERKYAWKLKQAETALADADKREQARSDKAIASAETNETETKAANNERRTIISKLLIALGVLPLIFGVLLLVAEANHLVSSQIPAKKPKQGNGGNNAGPRSAEPIENLYANPS